MLELLSEIKSLQSTGDNKIYPEGIFPSQRRHNTTGITREDDNSFFTALIVFTLQRLKKYLSIEEIKIVEEIKLQAQKAFPRYASKKVEDTYNFWRIEKNAHFPNGKIFSKIDYFALADDADCTALIYLAKGFSLNEIINLREKLIYHSSLPVKVSSNTLTHYRNLKLYSTWFGKYIPVEIDVCVTANLLYLLFESKTELNQFDVDSIKFICSVINNDEHKTHPFRIAPYYPKTSIILYHISRLLTVAENSELQKLIPKLKADILEKLAGDIHPMERIILNTSLIWLGETKNIEELDTPLDTKLPWFIAGILTSIENPIANWLAPFPLFHIQFYCEAYMKTLFLEYKILKDRVITHS
jgi:hypothetical protein